MKRSSVKRNFIYQMFYEVLVLILPLVTSPYISRILGTEGVGIYSYTHTIANYFVMFAALGIKNYGNREIARNRDNQENLDCTFSSLFLLHILVSFIVIAGYIIYIIFFSGEYRIYAIFQSLYIIGAMIDITWLFNGLEMFKITVVRNAAIKILTVVAVFIFVRTANDLWVYILIMALGTFLSQAYLWLRIPKLVKFRKTSFLAVRQHLPQLLILFIPTIAISLYNYMDKIMVGAIAGNSQLGLYENSEKIITTAFSTIAALGTVMLPRMSNMAAKGDQSGQKRSINNSMQFVLCLSVAMAFGLIAISNNFSVVFWGVAFSDCAILLTFLAVILPIKAYANVLRTQFLIPNKMDKVYTLSVCLGAGVNLIINFLLISRLGAFGAVIGTIFAEITVCVVQMIFCRKQLPIIKYMLYGVPYIFFGVVMAFFVYGIGILMGNGLTTLIIQILVGIIIYCFACLIYFKITDNRIFLDVIKRTCNKIARRNRRKT